MKYQLLRNNIITGPYTKETLIQHGIIVGDMIREEGTNQWQNATNFAEFKDNVSPTKPKYKITANKEVIEIKNEDAKEIKAAQIPANSPFKRMPSAIGKKKTTTEFAEDTEKKEVEKPIIHQLQKPVIHPVETQHINKYEQKKPVTKSLSSQPKSREKSLNITKEIVAPLLILGGVGFAAWFGYHKFSGGAETQNPSAIQAITSDTTLANNTIDSSKESKPIVTKKITIDSSLIYARRDSVRRIARVRRDSLTSVAKSNATIDSIQAQNQTVTKNITVKKIVAAPITETKKTADPIEQKPALKKSTSIGDYVVLSLNKIPSKEIKGIKLNIKNISNSPLNIAVIDVSYLDTAGKIIRGETLQTGNIAAGKTESLKVPNEKKAVNINYKVSLISGDSVYLMGK